MLFVASFQTSMRLLLLISVWFELCFGRRKSKLTLMVFRKVWLDMRECVWIQYCRCSFKSGNFAVVWLGFGNEIKEHEHAGLLTCLATWFARISNLTGLKWTFMQGVFAGWRRGIILASKVRVRKIVSKSPTIKHNFISKSYLWPWPRLLKV